jgi:hypothetical protein
MVGKEDREEVWRKGERRQKTKIGCEGAAGGFRTLICILAAKNYLSDAILPSAHITPQKVFSGKSVTIGWVIHLFTD